MKSELTPVIDPRNLPDFLQELLKRRLGYVPEWQPGAKGIDVAILQILARYLEMMAERLNQTPEKNMLAFFDLLGLRMISAKAARVPVTFQAIAENNLQEAALANYQSIMASIQNNLPEELKKSFFVSLPAVGALTSQQKPSTRVPAGTQVSAQNPANTNEQVVFMTEKPVGITNSKLISLYSTLPKQDQYIDHSSQFVASIPVQPFKANGVEVHQTPHELYIGHDTLLALAGKGSITLAFEISPNRSYVELNEYSSPSEINIGIRTKPINLIWEFWDGKKWCFGLKVDNDGEFDLTTNRNVTINFDFGYESTSNQTKNMESVVAGVKSFWIRARPKSYSLFSAGLPNIYRIYIKDIEINQYLFWMKNLPVLKWGIVHGASGNFFLLEVKNDKGEGVLGAKIEVMVSNPKTELRSVLTDKKKLYYRFDFEEESTDFYITLSAGNWKYIYQLHDFVNENALSLKVVINESGLFIIKAFSDGIDIDLTKPFYPLGQLPEPGACFYFTQDEAFSKSGAEVSMLVKRGVSPMDAINLGGEKLIPVVAWEYWNGNDWASLKIKNQLDELVSPDLDSSGIYLMVIPPDMKQKEVNKIKERWIRVRLVEGGYGNNSISDGKNIKITKPPFISNIRIGYSWKPSAHESPQYIITNNDFYWEAVDSNKAQIKGFKPFVRMQSQNNATYFGFDKPFLVDRMGLYFDIEQLTNWQEKVPVSWEYWNGEWTAIDVDDGTYGLQEPGILSFIGPADSKPYPRFGEERHWLRASTTVTTTFPPIKNIHSNSVWAVQQSTYKDVQLGASSGGKNQVFRINHLPILEGEKIEVCELWGGRAAIEWSMFVRSISNNPKQVDEIKALLDSATAPMEVVNGEVRLKLDRARKVNQVWVRWQEQPHLWLSSAADRHYMLDRARGLIFFGDGEHGRIPPVRAEIIAQQFEVSGGATGNIAAGTVTQLLSAVPGIQGVSNPGAAEGGANSETLSGFAARVPHTLRHRSRAITGSDYEAMAYEASPSVAMAMLLPQDKSKSGQIRLLIIPQSQEDQPQPSFGLREQVRQYIETHAPADIAEGRCLNVVGPEYFSVAVDATIYATVFADISEVESRAREAIKLFLHPLRGGPERQGWQRGRDVFTSDIAALLERLDGVDYLENLTLSGAIVLDVPDNKIAAAGLINLIMKQKMR